MFRWLWLAVLLAAPAQAADTPDDATRLPPLPLHERVLMLHGDPDRPVQLQVTLFTPGGPGPFPLAVMNHGASGSPHPEREPRYRTTFSAYYFLSRGYAVALPMMRGYAGSGGSVAHHGCDVAATALGNGRDIAGVIDALAALPGIDASHIVVAGQSFGGWNTLGFGAVGHAGVKALVNFAGGMRASDCAVQDAVLIAAAASLGARATAPSLWFYGDNDQTFPASTWRQMHARYTAAGGHATLVAYGRFMDDAHQLLSHAEGLPVWTARLDAFLRRMGLPGTPREPGYLPTPIPPASGLAAVDDAGAVPFLTEAGQADYRAFLRRPFTRAFAVAPNGTNAASDGGFDPMARALALCRQAAPGCALYAVDDMVVWTGPGADAAQPLVSRRTIAAGATATLNFALGVNRDCSSRGVPTIRLLQPPAHGTAAVVQRLDFPRFPSDSPFAACNAARVPGTAVDYTPARGFVGADSITFAETGADRHESLFRIDLTVR